jgi:four helix bundle protein
METETLLVISKNLNYIDDENFRMISEKLDETGKILQGLIKGYNKK